MLVPQRYQRRTTFPEYAMVCSTDERRRTSCAHSPAIEMHTLAKLGLTLDLADGLLNTSFAGQPKVMAHTPETR